MASFTNAAALVMLDKAVDDCDLGSTNPSAILNIYSGTPPANVDTALSGNALLAELVMSNPAFGAASDNNPGAISIANAITTDASANATGTASFARVLDRNRVARLQLSVGTVGTEIILNTTSITVGDTVSITALTALLPES